MKRIALAALLALAPISASAQIGGGIFNGGTSSGGGGSGTVTAITAGLGLGVTPGTCGTGTISTNGTISSCMAVNPQTGTYPIVNSDGGKLLVANSASSLAWSLPQATATGNFAAGWCTNIYNKNTGVLTVTPTTSTINGQSSLVLAQYGWASICSDGTNYSGPTDGGGTALVRSLGSGLTLTSGVLTASGGGSPGGSSGYFQYNNSGSFGGYSPGAALDALYQTSSTALTPLTFPRIGTTSYASQNLYNLNLDPTYLSHFRAAMALAKYGTRNAKILAIGDSTTFGAYSNGTGSGDYIHASYPTDLSNYLNRVGIASTWQSFFGSTNYANDSRLSVGSSWTSASGVNSLGGPLFTSSTSTNALTFTPTTPVDTFVVYYVQASGTGTINAVVNGNTTAINNGGGTGTLVSQTITTTLGMNSIALTWSVGNTAYVSGIVAYNSAATNALVMNAGWSGATSTNIAYNSTTYSPLASIASVAPDLTIIDIGINDWGYSTGVSTYKSNVQAVITQAMTTGDVILMTPVPSSIAGTSLAVQQSYVNALYQLAESNNIPIIDNFSRWVSYEVTNPLGLYANTLHPNGAGYSDQASAVATDLLNISGGGNNATSASGTVTNITMGNGLASTQSPLTTSGTMSLAPLSANQLLGSLTAVSPTGLSVPSCSSGSSALTWTSGTGFGCNTISGSGTVNSGTANQIAYYSATGTAVSGDAAITDNGTTITHTEPTTISSTSATALAVGANGATNPVLSVDASTASVATGLAIKGAATGGTTTITATDSGANTSLLLNSKGSGAITQAIATSGNILSTLNGTTVAKIQSQVGGSTHVISPIGYTSAAGQHFQYQQPNDTGLTASTEVNIEAFNNAAGTRSHATGALSLQRDFLINGSTDLFVGASTLTNGATLGVVLKSCGTNGTCTNESGLYIPTSALTGTVGTSYGINVAAATGATNNYAANFAGDITFTGSAPTVGTCGGGSIVTGSTDHKGQISGITAATACTITFSQALAPAPACTFSTNGGIVPTISTISTAAVTTSMTALTGTLYYQCF